MPRLIRNSLARRRVASKKNGVRLPVVAGIFYPALKRSLEDEVDLRIGKRKQTKSFVGILAPHGSFAACGQVLGALYRRVAPVRRAIVLGANHTGLGKAFAVAPPGEWEIPLGKIRVDEELTGAILEHLPEARKDEQAHEYEHSIEVQLPFLKRALGVRSFAAILFQTGPAEIVPELARGLAKVMTESHDEILLVVSTNLSQYEVKNRGEINDQRLLETIVSMDEEALLRQMEEQQVSLCGGFAAAVGMATAKALGARRLEVVEHATSREGGSLLASVSGFLGAGIER